MAVDDEGSSFFVRDDEDLAKRYEALSDDKKKLFDQHLEIKTDYRQQELPPYYREVLLTTLEKNLPDRAQGIEIADLNSKFDANPNWRENELRQQEVEHAKAERRVQERTIPDAPHRPGEISEQEFHALLGPQDINDDYKHGLLGRMTRQDQPQAQEQTVSKAPEPLEPTNVKTADPMQNVRPSGPDYSELQRTHEEVAAQLKQASAQPAGAQPPGPSEEPAAAMLSKDQLIMMIEHFPDIRREANILTTRSEISESAALAQMQDADRINLEQARGLQPDRQQQDERNLLDHQHLAEQAGVQAKWIALHLKAQNSPDAAQYGQDSRRAFQTARLTHEQRQKLSAGIDRSGEATPKVRDDQSQKQSDEQQALQGGNALSSGQRANLSPSARDATERKERAAAREVGAAKGKDQNSQPGNAGTGKSPGRGRSGR